MPQDINKVFGFDKIDKENIVVTYESDPNNLPEEFKGVEREIDASIEVPVHFREKTETWTRKN